MSTIRSRWAGKLAIRKKLLATARAKAAFWRRKKKIAATPAEKSHAGAMLADREKLVAERKDLFAEAERVIHRHTPHSLQARVVNFAEHTLARHVFEQGGNNHGPIVEEIIRYAGGQVGEPWCVDFVIYCYGHAGSNIVKPGFPRAVSLMHMPGTIVTSDPRPGDIIRYSFDHTGIFVKDNGDGTLTSIEGNTGASGAVSDGNGSDGVYKKIRAKTLVADYLRVES